MALAIRNHVALITGASRGIGAHTALALAAEGCHVALAARSTDDLQRVAAECGGYGVKTLALPADLAEMQALPHLVERCVTELGGLNIAVANAGVCYEEPVQQGKLAEWDAMLDLNLRSAMHLTRHALPHLIAAAQKSGHSSLVFISSMAGVRTYPHGAVYCATKFGLNGFASGVWDDVSPLGVKVSAICPSWTNTAMSAGEGLDTAMMIQPEDVAQLVRLVATWPDTSCPKMLQVTPQRWPRKL